MRLGTGATACIYLLPPLLNDLRQRFPSIEISVRTADTHKVMQDIETNEIDVGLVTLPAGGRAFDVSPILEDEFVAITALDGEPLRSMCRPGTSCGFH